MTRVVRVPYAVEQDEDGVVRISGNHHVMRHSDGRPVVVPVHSGRDMAKASLRNTLAIVDR